MRLLFFGMDGAFSIPPLKAVLQAGKLEQNGRFDIAAVILPASAAPKFKFDAPISPLLPEPPQSALPLLRPYLTENIIHLAWANNIPVFLVRQMRDPAVHAVLQTLQPDIACIACFPYLIPPDILTLPKYGCLNIHPSLLPDYRGPSPLFWIFRSGRQDQTGVTIHWMDEGLDSGDILSQRLLALPDGISGPEADQLCAVVGAEMLVEGLKQIQAGQPPRRPQPPGGSYQPRPTAEAFKLDPGWSARRAFNFMRGTAEWNHPYSLEIDSQSWTLTAADFYHPTQILERPVQEEDGRYRIQFTPGTLLAY